MDAPKSIAPARTPKDLAICLVRLEEPYRHELMGEDERLELRDTILRLRRSLRRRARA